jgi:fused signal recognition particle receptor
VVAQVLLCAADTYRAAAVNQLGEWALRAQVDIEKPRSDEERAPSVVSRSCDRANNEGYDVLIVDTSGRLSNNRNLNRELKKMKEIIAQKIPGGPHETILVVDAALGRNAVDQARAWKDAVGISSLVVTKLDGTARAGFVVSITRELEVPVKLVGVGEGIGDLRDFEPAAYVDSLLGYDAEMAELLQLRAAENATLLSRLSQRLMENSPSVMAAARQAQASLSVGPDPGRSSKARRRASKKAKK